MTTTNPTNSQQSERLEPCGVCKFHWNMIVMPGDTHNRNCPHYDDEEKGCTCQGCGRRYKVDIEVPDDLWNRIRPEGKPEGKGLLCGRCIFSRIEALDKFDEFTLTVGTVCRARVAGPRYYFCSCGGACTAGEYITHYFELGHDRAEDNPSVGKFIATIADGLRHAIRDHGDITKERIGSAAKRVWGRIRDTRYDPFRSTAAASSPTPAESVVIAGRVVNISTHGEPTRVRLQEIQTSVSNGYEREYRKSGWSKALRFAIRDLHFLLTFFRDDVTAAAPADNDAELLLATALESQEFYELMQSYRHASLTKQSEVVKHYETVKEYIRNTTKGVR